MLGGATMIVCKRCGDEKHRKNGILQGKQRYRCSACGYNFTEGDGRRNPALPAKKALAVLLYSLGKGSFSMIGKLFGHSPSLIYRWINEAAATIADPEISEDIKEMEFDETKALHWFKKNKLWIIKAVDRGTGRTVAWIIHPLAG
jgi:transposase-like protein